MIFFSDICDTLLSDLPKSDTPPRESVQTDEGNEHPEEPRPNREQEEVRTPEEKIMRIIEEPNTTRAKAMIEEIRGTCMDNGEEIKDIERDIVELLLANDGKRWPGPQDSACPLVIECDQIRKDDRNLTEHIFRAHRVDIERVSDEILKH